MGELTAWTDAKGQNFTAQYDALSRMTQRIDPDLTSTWIWGTGTVNGAPAYNIGKLQAVTAGAYSELYAYDTVGRLQTRTITSDATYQYDLAYNSGGRLSTLTYPASYPSTYRFEAKFSYQNGILLSIADATAGTVFWTANATNPSGQYTQETLGNGIVSVHNFDAVTGELASVTAGAGGSAALQNNSYLFDAVGNVTERQDNNQGLTENFYYDSLNRLDHSTLNGVANLQMSYDAMSNVTAFDEGGNNTDDYTTPQPGCTYYANSQPHAVRANTWNNATQSFCYDANGNMLNQPWGGQSMWTSYNQPNAVSYGGSMSTFWYDQNHQRWRQVASYSGSSEVTLYVGDLMEKVTNASGTTYRHYIPAGNSTVLWRCRRPDRIRSTTSPRITWEARARLRTRTVHWSSRNPLPPGAGERTIGKRGPAMRSSPKLPISPGMDSMARKCWTMWIWLT